MFGDVGLERKVNDTLLRSELMFAGGVSMDGDVAGERDLTARLAEELREIRDAMTGDAEAPVRDAGRACASPNGGEEALKADNVPT